MPIDREKIRRLRLQLHLTQDEAAKRAGLRTRQAWCNIERRVGKDPEAGLSLRTLNRVAAVLGVKVKDLLK